MKLRDKITLTPPTSGSDKKPLPFRNVALLPEDHVMLRQIADADQRTMTRQLSVMIRKEYQCLENK